MTISVAIKPELEARLAARARTSGQSLEGLIEGILEQEAGAFDSIASSPQLTGAERARAFRAWAKGFPASGATLGLDDVSRESFYERE
ncbi:MAG: hypothetical protein NTV52_25615 [Acidobacteria bacterium]|nr:hypothetical protein [Acidobacteriota bacterium]